MSRLLALVLAAAAALLVLPAAAGAVTIGIADQKTQMFKDERFRDLGVGHARYVVPWDVDRSPEQRDRLDTWMRAASAAGVRPLLVFGHSWRPAHRRELPRPAALQQQFRALRARYPFAADWATWNEPNHCGEPTCKQPELVARYYEALKRACGVCTILGGEVLDMPNMERWVKRFLAAAPRAPRHWGLHNYIDANRFRTSGTRALLRITRGEIWFTETGGLVRRNDRQNIVRFDESPEHAGRATEWLFGRLVGLDRRRITRVYLYHWNGSGPDDTWDSALIGLNDEPRPAFLVLKKYLERFRASAAASRPK